MKFKEFIDELVNGNIKRVTLNNNKSVVCDVSVSEGRCFFAPTNKSSAQDYNQITNAWGCDSPKEDHIWWVNMFNRKGELSFGIPLANFKDKSILKRGPNQSGFIGNLHLASDITVDGRVDLLIEDWGE